MLQFQQTCVTSDICLNLFDESGAMYVTSPLIPPLFVTPRIIVSRLQPIYTNKYVNFKTEHAHTVSF